jgi:hypothetical protein
MKKAFYWTALAALVGCSKSPADIEAAYQRCMAKVPPDMAPTQVDIVGGPPSREGAAQHDKHTAALAACRGIKQACTDPGSLVCAAELNSHGQ